MDQKKKMLTSVFNKQLRTRSCEVVYFLFVLTQKERKRSRAKICCPPACRATPAFGSGHRAGRENDLCITLLKLADAHVCLQLLVPITVGKQLILSLAGMCASQRKHMQVGRGKIPLRVPAKGSRRQVPKAHPPTGGCGAQKSGLSLEN